MTPIMLASAPFRRNRLKRLRLLFDAITPGIDETGEENEGPT